MAGWGALPERCSPLRSPLRAPLGLEQRERNHIADRGTVGEEHGQTINADAQAAGRRHAHLQGLQKILIDALGLEVAGRPTLLLALQTLTLIDWINQLTEGIGGFAAHDEELKTLHQAWLAAVGAGQRRDLDRIIEHERRLDQVGFHRLLKRLTEQAAHGVGEGGDLQPLGLHGRGSVLAAGHGREIKPTGLLHQLMHGGPPPGRSQVNCSALVGDGSAAAHLETDRRNQLLGELHHVDVIGIGLVDLHRGELGVVAGAHPLIAKNAAQLIDPLKAAHHQTFEVELGGNPQGEGQVEGVVMGLKRPGIGPTGHALQHRGFDLQKTPLIQPTADATDQQGAPPEGFTGVGRHDQIEIALAIALLHVGQTMPFVGQRLQGLAEHGPAADLHRQLAPVGAAQGSRHTDQVTRIHQGGELGEGPGLQALQCGLVEIELNRPTLIGEGEEGQLAHHPPGHHPTGHDHLEVAFLTVGQVGVGLLQRCGAVGGPKAQGIGLTAKSPEGFGFLQTGLAQIRQGLAGLFESAHPAGRRGRVHSLAEGTRRINPPDQPAAAIAPSPMRWEA